MRQSSEEVILSVNYLIINKSKHWHFIITTNTLNLKSFAYIRLRSLFSATDNRYVIRANS